MADLTITAANVVKDSTATVVNGVADTGVTVTAGQVVYQSATTGGLPAFSKAIDTGATAAAAAGIALNGASPGQPLAVLTDGLYTVGATVAVGQTYGVTDTAGGLGLISERNAGDYITIIGVATTAAKINVKINASGVALAA
jgi:hypothetical protein